MSKNSTKRVLASAAALCLVLSSTPVLAAETATAPNRLAGKGRIQTAISIAEASWKGEWKTSKTAILAGWKNEVDALAVSPLAYKLQAPVLLNDTKDSINAETLKSLKDQGVKKVFVATGTGIISDKAVAQLKAEGIEVERLGGKSRYETAKNIYDAFKKNGGNADTVALVSGTGLADALSVAPIAAKQGMPILMTSDKNTIATDLQEVAKAAKKVYAVGGTGIISDALVSEIKAERLGGASRWETNAKVIEAFAKDGKVKFDKVYLANGMNGLVDALTGSVLAAQSDSPIVLADKGLDSTVKTVLKGKVTDKTSVVALGGEGVVTAGLVDAVKEVNKVEKPVATELKVESVSAVNLKEVQIKFSQAVDHDTLLDANDALLPNTVSITDLNNGGVIISSAELSEDGMVLNLKINNALSNNTYYNFIVKGIKNENAQEIVPYSQAMKITDAVAPAIKTIASKTKDAITHSVNLEFNEPVMFDSVRVGDKFVAISSADNSFGKKWTLNTSEDLESGKTYNVTINGLRDVAGNYAANPTTLSVQIVRDEVKPTFTLKAANPRAFDIAFDKQMKSNVQVDSIIVKDSKGNELPQSDFAVLKADGQTFRVTLLQKPIASDKKSEELTVYVKDLADSLGNVVSSATQKVVLVNDEVKPTMTNVRVKPGAPSQIEVTFSEKVQRISGAALDPSVFTVTDSKNNVIAIAANGVSALDSNNRVVLTLSSALSKSDTYKVALSVNTVEDLWQNKADAQVMSFNYAKATATAPQLVATIVDTGVKSSKANRKVTISFNQADVVNKIDPATGNYKAGAADNVLNYTLNGAALPAGATIAFNDVATVNGGVGDTVTLDFTNVEDSKLPSELSNGGNIVVTVSNIQTEAGSTVQYQTKPIVVVDETKPTIKSAYLMKVTDANGVITGYKLTAIMSEKMATVDKSDFILSDGTTDFVADTAAIEANNETRVTLTFTTNVNAVKAAINNTFTLKTVAQNALTGNTKDKAAKDPIPANVLEADTKGITVTNYAR